MADTRKKVIAGNWKMNCSRAEAIQLASHLIASSEPSEQSEIVVFVPFVHFADVAKLTVNSHIRLGAQDGHWEDKGAFTGEVSASMLKDYSVESMLVGHSERREMFGDDDQRVAKKFEAALKNGLEPILCIGESLEQREQGITLEVLQTQVKAVIDQVGIKAFANAKIAYEPIWAIGTGKTATPEQAQAVHADLRRWLSEFDNEIAAKVQILYGGSMNAANAETLLSQPDIDGGLIGGASLKAEDFLKIYSFAG
jgi:triosephosphate isomerase